MSKSPTAWGLSATNESLDQYQSLCLHVQIYIYINDYIYIGIYIYMYQHLYLYLYLCPMSHPQGVRRTSRCSKALERRSGPQASQDLGKGPLGGYSKSLSNYPFHFKVDFGVYAKLSLVGIWDAIGNY